MQKKIPPKQTSALRRAVFQGWVCTQVMFTGEKLLSVALGHHLDLDYEVKSPFFNFILFIVMIQSMLQM